MERSQQTHESLYFFDTVALSKASDACKVHHRSTQQARELDSWTNSLPTTHRSYKYLFSQPCQKYSSMANTKYVRILQFIFAYPELSR